MVEANPSSNEQQGDKRRQHLTEAVRKTREAISKAADLGAFEEAMLAAVEAAGVADMRVVAEAEGRRLAAAGKPIGPLLGRIERLFATLGGASTEASLPEFGAAQREAIVTAACSAYAGYFHKQSTDQGRALVALTEENARLRHSDETLLARVSEIEALQKVNNALNSTLHLSEVLAQTVHVVSQVTKVDVCSIFLFEEASNLLVLRATKGLNLGKIGQLALGVGEGITGTAAAEGRPIAVRDAWSDARFKVSPGLDEEPYHSMIAVPIVLYTVQKLIGVLTLETVEYRDFNPEDLRFLETVAGQIAIAIQNARNYGITDEKLRQKVNQLTTLQRVSALIASTLDLQQVLNQIATLVVGEIGADMSAIYEMDEATGDLVIVASHGLSEDYARNVLIRPGEGALGTAVATRAPVAVSDALGDTRFSTLGPRATRGGYRSICCVPLIAKQRVIGGISAYYREQQQFDDDQLRMLSAFGDQAAVAIENARLYEQARRSLVTKSALLLEMHHRVKNNLQTVAALLSLQMRRAKSDTVIRPLGESIARIQSIATVHDLLSSGQVGHVSVGDLLKPMIEVATINLVPPGKRIAFVVEGQSVVIGSKEANVLALLLNELIANAIRHGFAERDRGVITISATDDGHETKFKVHHDGAGLPPGFDLERDAGLGLQIVQTLVRNDLRGTFDLHSDEGTTAEITFCGSDIPLW